MRKELAEKIKSLPLSSGVYKFLDKEGKIIYVGKAKSLRLRVNQYFQSPLKDGKTKQLVENIWDVGFIEVFSELESLILEAELIKKYKPKYNINLKDDKSYLYIIIKKEGEFDKVIVGRKSHISKGDISFGPYPDSKTVRYIVRAIRKIFPFRDCSLSKFKKYQKSNSPCLYGHIGLCLAPCCNPNIKGPYKSNIKQIKLLLRGKKQKIITDLENQMSKYAKKQMYEKAQKVKLILEKFQYITQNFKNPQEFIQNPYLVQDIYAMALDELMRVLPHLKTYPERIECFDVSHISGKEAAVSMVVAINGRLDKSSYKRFKIKLKQTPDDYFMLKEALFRRFLREVRENLSSWGMPNLVIVDGGKGQVSCALEVLGLLGLKIPVIGIAKKHETIIYKEESLSGEGEFRELVLNKNLEALKLIQRLRDESHRFAKAYHHQLRSKLIGE